MKPIPHIRPFQSGDAPRVFQAIQQSLADVSAWLSDLQVGLTLSAVQAYIDAQPSLRAERRAYNFAIVDRDTDGILGGCGLTLINWQHRFANLYYWVRSDHVRQGIASAAALQLAGFGFGTLELQRIEIVVATGNTASARVAEKIGAKYEGMMRSRIAVRGVRHDAFMYSLIPSDLQRRSPPLMPRAIDVGPAGP